MTLQCVNSVRLYSVRVAFRAALAINVLHVNKISWQVIRLGNLSACSILLRSSAKTQLVDLFSLMKIANIIFTV